MSWYQDPQLFICNAYNAASHGFNEYRCKKQLSDHIHVSDLHRVGSNVQKGRDFDALLAYLINSFVASGSNTWRIVNCQGLAIIWEGTCHGVTCSWSREPLNSPYYNLSGITPPVDAEALKRRVSDLESRNSTLEAEVRRNSNDKNTLIGEKQDLERQVSELTSKLKECCGSADEEPLKSGNNANWVAFEDLDVLNIPRNTSLKITKAPGALKLVEDDTTNVRASRFHGGIYLVAVNVEELIPGKDEARFDPTFWGQYKNAGTSYAA
ncbi:hypothetical protein MKX01_003131, partial [Papaver californicum]